jgi:hypothetical protein
MVGGFNAEGTDFNIFINAINIKDIKTIMNLQASEELLKELIAFSITKRLEGVNLSFPKKEHRSSYARILVNLGLTDSYKLSKYTKLSQRTIQNILKQERENGNRTTTTAS